MDTIKLRVQDSSGQQDHPRGSFGHLQKTRTGRKGQEGHSATVGIGNVQSFRGQDQTLATTEVATLTKF